MHPEIPVVAVDAVPSDAVLLDVREDYEWFAGHIPGAVHVPMNRLPQRLQFDPGPLTPEASIVVVCKMGGRSSQVTAWLRHHGYDAVNLDGGMLAWATAHRPMEAHGDVPPQVV